MIEQKMPAWAEGQLRLRDSMHWWIEKSTKSWKNTPWGGGHDEGIFTRTWMSYYLLTGDKVAYDYLDRLVNEFIDSPVVEACTCFLKEEDAAQYPKESRRPPYHGYCEDQACFVHAPENYAWFLTHIAHINPSPKVLRALEDCAEHVGNWSPDAEPWYDWNNHRFRSAIFGTKMVRDYPPYDFEPLALVRVMVLATNQYYISGEQKYLDVAVDWADKWAEIVLGCDPEEGFPTTLFPHPVEVLEEKYGDYANMAKGRAKLNYELGNLFLDLYYFTRKQSYAQAVHKMLNTELDWNKYRGGNAAATGMLEAKYRSLTGDKSFDDRIVKYADEMLLDESDNRPAIALMNKSSERFVGKPGLAYLRLFKNDRVELDTRSTGILTVAFMITHDTKYLEYAMQLAANRFADSHYIWDGRELGCRGSWQGRNGVAIHNVMSPMMLSAMGGFGMLEGERPWFEVRYNQADGQPGLPEKVAALFIPGEPNERVIRFYNDADDPQTVRVTPDNTLFGEEPRALQVRSAALDGTPIDDLANGIAIPPKQLVELKIAME